MQFLDDLNPAQRNAVEHSDGPSIVIAGAGSGKTRVLTYKVANMLIKGINPFEILMLTFTNKAAKEMKKRIFDLVPEADARSLWAGTFHSVFSRILRIESDVIGYPRNFSIYDTEDSKRLLKNIIKEMQLDDKKYKPGPVFNRISLAKNNLITPEKYHADEIIQNEDAEAKRPMLGQIYTLYQSRLEQAAAMDFDDLLLNTYLLLKNNIRALNKYQGKFKYVLVDEFQDTNHCQYLILKKITARYQNICVVGDDAQSIYAFRGAHIRNMLYFHNDYPDAVTFKLEQNYRSTKNIVAAANSVIAKNKQQLHKKVWTENTEGEKIKILQALTDNEEGHMVAREIFYIKNHIQARNKDFAVIYRTHAQSRAMEDALRKINIPYKVYGGLSFYQRKEVKDMLAYFRLCINPKDEEALRRVINYPARGIGKTTLEKLTVAASEHACSIWEAACHPAEFCPSINKGIASKLSEFTTMINSFGVQLGKMDAFEIARHIAVSSGILRELKNDESAENQIRIENIGELLNAIQAFTSQALPDEKERWTLQEFMQEVALLTDMDEEEQSNMDRVSLMTIHSAKGLEFPYVLITGLEDGLFPSHLSLNSKAELEEERRLFYVAITRAMRKVVLSYSLSRYKWGELTDCEPSRFLDEIDEACLLFPQTGKSYGMSYTAETPAQNKTNASGMPPAGKKNLIKKRTVHLPPPPFDADHAADIQAGMTVEHQRFGKGKVLLIEGEQADRKATVFFNSHGQKQLLLKYARLRIVH